MSAHLGASGPSASRNRGRWRLGQKSLRRSKPTPTAAGDGGVSHGSRLTSDPEVGRGFTFSRKSNLPEICEQTLGAISHRLLKRPLKLAVFGTFCEMWS